MKTRMFDKANTNNTKLRKAKIENGSGCSLLDMFN